MQEKILNLAIQDQSTIKYKVSKFPDGQQSITITETNGLYADEVVCLASHLNSFTDLELIICATQALREMGVRHIYLYVPYFLGARSDRKFVPGSFNYLKTVICPIINSQGYDRVLVLDPHSDVLEACLNNFEKIDNVDVVKFAINTSGLGNFSLLGNEFDGEESVSEDLVLISPDAGALKKIYHVAEALGYKKDILIASKHRDIETGKILRTDVPLTPEHDKKAFMIIDDICDGGRTFIEIAKVILETYPDAKIYLTVTHGIFSAGFAELGDYFDGIYCSTSIKTVGDESADNSGTGRTVKTKVKQFVVF